MDSYFKCNRKLMLVLAQGAGMWARFSGSTNVRVCSFINSDIHAFSHAGKGAGFDYVEMIVVREHLTVHFGTIVTLQSSR